MCLNSSAESCQQLLDHAQIGCWKADFAGKYYICSDYLVRLFGRTDTKLTFYEFHDLIREDYRSRITSEFLSILILDVYEQVFPIHTCYGVKWVQSKMYRREQDKQGNVTAYGLLQVVPDWVENVVPAGKIQSNTLLNHLGSLSRSLFSFIQTRDLDFSVHKVLTATLHALEPAKGRIYIMETDTEKKASECKYEICSEGVNASGKLGKKVLHQSIPWVSERVGALHSVLVNTLDELPPEASFEKKMWEEEGVCSALLIPMTLKENASGCLGIHIVGRPHLWSNEDYQWLLSITNVITLITEMTKAYEALDQKEKILSNIYKNIPVGIELYDRNGDLQDLNKKDMEIFGVTSKKDVEKMNIFQSPVIPTDVIRKMRQHEPVTFRLNYAFDKVRKYYLSEKEGKIDIVTKVSMLYDSKNELLNYMLINLDNTEQLIAQHRLEEFENMFSLVSNYAKAGYAKFDLISGDGYAIRQWYHNLGEIEGTPLPEIIGVYNHVHEDDRKVMLDFFKKVKRGEAHHIRKELRIMTENGMKWTRVNVMRNRQYTGSERIEMYCINYDITELKENQLQREKAEELDRLKSAFLANMSHEIRTPLNAIVGFSSLLAETEEQEDKQSFVDIIQRNNELLLQLISDILDLAKIESNTLEFTYKEIDVKDLLQEVAATFRIKMPPGVELRYARELPACQIYSDSVRLLQVLSNFLTNAIKYTTEGSITLDYEWQPEVIRFSVKDTGEGIPAEVREHIFDRFYKGDNFKQGTGLGLSICETIVGKLGGEIGVDSEVGKGSCFWFTVPHGQ